MRDLNLNRVINVMAAGSILLTATACGGPERRLARKACKATYKCDRSDFEEEYSSMKDCVDEVEGDIEDALDYVEDYAGRKCADALLAFYTCSAKAYKKSCDSDDIEDDCEDEIDDLEDDCGFDYYDYY